MLLQYKHGSQILLTANSLPSSKYENPQNVAETSGNGT